jgi:hypothetical protein
MVKESAELRRLRDVSEQTPIEDLARRFRGAICQLRTVHGFIPRSREDVPHFLAGMTIDRVGMSWFRRFASSIISLSLML